MQSSPAPSSPPISWRKIILLLLIIAAALALRIHQLHQQPLWLDEMYSLELSAGHGYAHATFPLNTIIHSESALTSLHDASSLRDIWINQANDSHPPLYFVTLRVWRDVCGQSELAARTLSITFSLISILLLFLLTQRLFGTIAALGSAIIMALAPAQIRYALEIRPYAMSQALCLATGLTLITLESRGPNWRRATLLIVLLLAMLLTHYLTLGVAIAFCLYAIIRVRRSLWLFPVAAMLFLLIWGSSLLQMSHRSHDLFDWLLGTDPPKKTLEHIALMPFTLLAEPDRHASAIQYIAILLLLLPLLLLRQKPKLLFPLCWVGCVLGLLAISDLFRHTLMLRFVRYALVAAPGVYMIYAALGRFVTIAALIFCIVSIPTLNEPEHEQWDESAQWIAKHPSENSLIILLAHPHDWESTANMMFLNLGHYLPRRDYLLLHDRLPPELLPKVKAYQNIYIFSSRGTSAQEVGLDAVPKDVLYVPQLGSLAYAVNP